MMPAATTPMPTAAAVAAAAVTAKINAMDLAVQVPHPSLHSCSAVFPLTLIRKPVRFLSISH